MHSTAKLVIAVIGAGTMGRGIVQLFAQSGYSVKLFDQSAEAVANAQDSINERIQNKVTKGRINEEEATAIINRITATTSLNAIGDCGVVIEAIIENIDIKQNLFVELEQVVSSTAILASNTSSLLVAEIGARCQQPERVAGLHFFNPVPAMRVVEIISAVNTSENTVKSLKQLVETTGHRAVVAEDQPGFLINHAGRGLYTEGLRILEERAASPRQVDQILRDAADFRMGPFELFDLTGLDVSGKVLESIYEQFQQEPRFRPSSIIPPRIAAGLHGRKTGKGWYDYSDNTSPGNEAPAQTADIQTVSVWIDEGADEYNKLSELVKKAGAQLTESANQAQLQLIQPWGIDATQACADLGLDGRHCVAVDPLPGLEKHRTLMLTPITSEKAKQAAIALLTLDGVTASVINDSPGFVTQRVLATIVNIGTNIAQRGIANVADIDDAVSIGLGYPLGPLSLGDRIGGNKIMKILEGMLKVTGDMRYRPSFWLRRRASLGQPLTTEEASRATITSGNINKGGVDK
jgi:3-hydroxybutyryl-CoA dehydrogenase